MAEEREQKIRDARQAEVKNAIERAQRLIATGSININTREREQENQNEPELGR